METINWTNDATCKVNQEIVSQWGPVDFDLMAGPDMALTDLDELAHAFKHRLIYYIEMETSSGFARDFALSYLENVDWHQLAKMFVEQYITE